MEEDQKEEDDYKVEEAGLLFSGGAIQWQEEADVTQTIFEPSTAMRQFAT